MNTQHPTPATGPTGQGVLVVPITREILANATIGELASALHDEGYEVQIIPAGMASLPETRVLARRGDYHATGASLDLRDALAAAALYTPGVASRIHAADRAARTRKWSGRRGGPCIGPQAEEEYRREQADYDD
ncbi:hypothetical protein Aph01nite_12880 [Acrocarpospora phusangensis]|uniref:Uncharacterized protein n=1 Tax=Acrocarpospora phusangensis TaxID=1070424 RepID=A0A919Q8T8_9ACTN|nr:hypothetical protein [Acrocarpospora phusangensis]GIH22978.1 hypothetical protein Aph01nite_12880 [Acrocarpospora phusangensis]